MYKFYSQDSKLDISSLKFKIFQEYCELRYQLWILMSLWRPDLWIDEIWTIFNSEGKVTVATDCLRVLPKVLQINMNFVLIVVMMYQQCGYIYLKPKTVTSWFNHGVKIKDRNNRTIVPQNMKTIEMKE